MTVLDSQVWKICGDNKTVQDHDDIVKLLRRKDVKKAKDVLRVHLSRFQTDKAKIQAAHENYFK